MTPSLYCFTLSLASNSIFLALACLLSDSNSFAFKPPGSIASGLSSTLATICNLFLFPRFVKYLKFALKFLNLLCFLYPSEFVFEIKKIIFSFSFFIPSVACVLVVENDPDDNPIFTKFSSKFSNVVIEITPPAELPKKDELLPL